MNRLRRYLFSRYTKPISPRITKAVAFKPKFDSLEDRVVPDGRPLPFPVIYVGAETGAPPIVKAYDAETGKLAFERTAFESTFTGGVRIATADFTLDAFPDLVVAPGAGGGPRVRILDGKTGNEIPGPLGNFLAFESSFTGGVELAAGDVNNDGIADLMVGAGKTGGPHVRVFDGFSGRQLLNFMAFDDDFRGGVSLAAADFNGDGKSELIIGAGPDGGPHVKTYDVTTGLQISGPLGNFFAFEESFRGGVHVGSDWKTGDVTGDGTHDLIVGAGPGRSPDVKVYSGKSGQLDREFLAFPSSMTAGVRVAAAYITDDVYADIVVATGMGAVNEVRVFDGKSKAQLSGAIGTYTPFGPANTNGVTLAATNDPPAPMIWEEDAPAIYQIQMTSSQFGASGNSAYPFDGEVSFLPNESQGIDGSVVLYGQNTFDALRQMLTGYVEVAVGENVISYPVVSELIGFTPLEEKPFLLSIVNGVYTLGLEDLALADDPNEYPDWDYDDVTWTFNSQPYTGSTEVPLQSYAPFEPVEISEEEANTPGAVLITGRRWAPIWPPITTPPPDEEGSISGIVWNDNAPPTDHLRQSFEPRIPGIQVTLEFTTNGTTFTPVGTPLITGSAGDYTFNKLSAGNYRVKFARPSGATFSNFQSTASVGYSPMIDCDVNLSDASYGYTPLQTISSSKLVYTNIDAGLKLPPLPPNPPPEVFGSISGIVWNDYAATPDHIRGTNEPRLSGITVGLQQAASPYQIVQTKISNASGNYTFTGLSLNTSYKIVFTRPADSTAFSKYQWKTSPGYSTTNDCDVETIVGLDGRTQTINISNSSSLLLNHRNIDAGIVVPPPPPIEGTISGVVWDDLVQGGVNPNGIRDGVDSYRSGQLLTLINASTQQPWGYSTTNGNGVYSFTNVPKGNYQVRTGVPYQTELTLFRQGSNTLIDSDFDRLQGGTTTAATPLITIDAKNQTYSNWDAGFKSTTTSGTSTKISGYVWDDNATKDGLRNAASDKMIPGVLVALGRIGAGTTFLNAYTNASGYYEFTNVAFGDYQVRFWTGTYGVGFSPYKMGTNTTIDSDVRVGDGSGTGWTPKIAISASTPTATNVDAGFMKVTSSDYINTVTVEATDDYATEVQWPSNIGVIRFTRTAENMPVIGNSLNVNFLAAGSATWSSLNSSSKDYRLFYDDNTEIRTSYVTFKPGVETLDIQLRSVDDSVAENTEWSELSIETSSYYLIDATSNSGVVVIDDNANKPSVTITASSATTQEPAATQINPPKGEFTFTRIGGTTTLPLRVKYSIGGTADKSDYVENISGELTFLANETIKKINISPIEDGKSEPAETVILTLLQNTDYTLTTTSSATVTISDYSLSNIGNYVWEDANANGIQDNGERGIPNVKVDLLKTVGGALQIVETTTTDNSGAYQFGGGFADISPGQYVVKFTLPNGYVLSPKKQGSDTSVDSDPNLENNQTDTITLAAGERNYSIDAGMIKLSNYAPNIIQGPEVVPGNSYYYYSMSTPGNAAGYTWRLREINNGNMGNTAVRESSTSVGGAAGNTILIQRVRFNNTQPIKLAIEVLDAQNMVVNTKEIILVKVSVTATPALTPRGINYSNLIDGADFYISSQTTQNGVTYAGIDFKAKVTLTGPGNNEGVNKIHTGFLQNVTMSKLRAQYLENGTASNTRWLIHPRQGQTFSDVAKDQPGPWYSSEPISVLFSPQNQAESTKEISSNDSPQKSFPATWEFLNFASMIQNDPNFSFASSIFIKYDFSLFVGAQTIVESGGANNYYWAESNINWSFNTDNDAATIKFKPNRNAQTNIIESYQLNWTKNRTAFTVNTNQWTEVTSPTPYNYSAPTLNSVLDPNVQANQMRKSNVPF